MTKIYNPKTKKYIDSESRQFNNTIRKLSNEFNLVNNILVPKNKTNYGLSEKKDHWVKLDNKINKIYTKNDNDVIKMKDELVYGIKGRIIKKSSKSFKNLIQQGYQLDTDRLIKPTQLTVANANREDFIMAVSNNSNPYKFILDGEDSDGNRLFYIVRFLNDKYAIEEFIRLSNSGEYTFDVYFIYKKDYIEYGPAYNSNTTNCVINCVKQHFFKNKYKLPKNVTWEELYNKYVDGFMESDYDDLKDITKCNIKVRENNNQHEYYDTKWDKKKILKLVYKNNHVEIDEQKEFIIKTIKINNKCNCLDNLTFGEFNHTCDTLENVFNNENISNIEKVFLQGKKIIGYQTVDNKNYQNQFDIIELQDNELSYMTYLRKNIKKYFSNEISPIKDDLKIIQQVTKNVIYYTKPNNNDNYKLDLTKAYDHFQELPTDLLYKINTDKFIDRMGYSLITYIDPITKVENTIWQFNEFIKQILIKYNIEFTITQGMYSSNTTTLNIQQFYEDNKEIHKCDKRIFHKIIGSWQVYKFTDNKITDDLSISSKYGGFEIKDGLYIYDNDKEYTKTSNYYPHIVGAIHAYTNIKIYDIILKYNLDPIKIWTDGITLEKSVINKFTNWKLKKGYSDRFECSIDGFHIEKSKKNNDEVVLTSNHDKLENIKANYIIEFSKYKSMVLDELIELNKKNDFIIELPKDKISVVAGEGGTGKTGLIKLLEHIYKTTILTPTNMVKKHYKKGYTVYSFLNPKQFKILINGILLIDEYSMVSQEELDKLIEMYNPIKVIIFGDLIQLPCIYGTPITKYNIEYLTINHRAKDDPILQKCLKYTRAAKDGYITYLKNRKINLEDAIKCDSMILSTTNSDVDQINKLGLSLNNNKQISNSELKINTPIIITTNSLEKDTTLVNNDYGFISNFNENEIILNINDELINVDMKHLKHIKPAYSLTYHKVQGLTVTKKVILNLHKINIFNRNGKDIIRNLLYVGVSRVKKLDQLHILDHEF